MIPYGRQDISQADIDAVVDVLKSDFLTQGPMIGQFEAAIALQVGAPHALAVNSATSALHIACLALGVGPGDNVWTSPNTFVASANCARYCGATVDFVDIDPRTYNMCAKELSAKLEKAKVNGTLPKVVIPVHFAGLPCDLKAIHSLSKIYGFSIIEDASHAIGGSYEGAPIGNCQFSHITVFSFHPVKIITTGEGGMVTTRSGELAHRMQLLRSHGITRAIDEFIGGETSPWYYEQQTLGFNYRMTDMQAALGISQVKRLPQWINRRHQIADTYDAAFSKLPVILPTRNGENNTKSALHLYPIRLNREKSNINRKDAFFQLREAGIGVNVHYIPVHTQPYFSQLGFRKGDFPACEQYYEECLSLPMHTRLTSEDLTHVIASFKSLFF
jgi:UDP-4-amino-4,6-dideoxy-N-acetyl-beta-L-altrosamine transaminase